MSFYQLAEAEGWTKDNKYLDEVKRQMPVVEAFNGFQPSYHLNEVGIRHWDGHWFGKREMFGDTFPHYWSSITGAVYYYYALCTGDKSYMERAQNVVRNNLCLFFEDGRASCAYMYPYKINGIKAEYFSLERLEEEIRRGFALTFQELQMMSNQTITFLHNI